MSVKKWSSSPGFVNTTASPQNAPTFVPPM